MKPCLFALFATSMLASNAVRAADCSREDIDHYLDRGFSPQQVLELCRPQASTAANDPAQEKPVDASYWRDVIDGFAVSLSADYLHFSRQQCVEYDRPNYAEQRKKACGKAHYSIGLAGMKVLDTSKKLLFWGINSVQVSSPDVQARYELGQDAMRSRDRALLDKALAEQQDVQIPIRDGTAMDAVRLRLEQLAR